MALDSLYSFTTLFSHKKIVYFVNTVFMGKDVTVPRKDWRLEREVCYYPQCQNRRDENLQWFCFILLSFKIHYSLWIIMSNLFIWNHRLTKWRLGFFILLVKQYPLASYPNSSWYLLLGQGQRQHKLHPLLMSLRLTN